MSESNESSDISDGSNYYSETEISDVSFEDPGIVGLYNNEPEYGEEEIKKTLEVTRLYLSKLKKQRLFSFSFPCNLFA